MYYVEARTAKEDEWDFWTGSNISEVLNENEHQEIWMVYIKGYTAVEINGQAERIETLEQLPTETERLVKSAGLAVGWLAC